MRGEAGPAFAGALGYVAFALVSPLNLGGGAFGISLWLVPLIAVHLWPRDAHVGLSGVLLLGLGLLGDMYVGLSAGTTALAALLWFALTRPDRREGEVGENRLWLTFGIGIALVVAATILLSGPKAPAVLTSVVMDGLVAVLAFPVGYRILRFARLLSRDPGEESFP